MRILFVEDDREVADYVSRCLEEENNTVTLSFDGASALAPMNRIFTFDCSGSLSTWRNAARGSGRLTFPVIG